MLHNRTTTKSEALHAKTTNVGLNAETRSEAYREACNVMRVLFPKDTYDRLKSEYDSVDVEGPMNWIKKEFQSIN